MQVACFSEKKDNMPMWGNYADNHKGICIEYDFSQLGANSEFLQGLYPVVYEAERFDYTADAKKMVDFEKFEVSYLPFFLLMLKHDSWEYEQEWRYLYLDTKESESAGETVTVPVKPTAIYFGKDCEEKDIKAVSSCVDSGTKLYKLEIKNHEFFHLDTVK
jgi:hypothetical protein